MDIRRDCIDERELHYINSDEHSKTVKYKRKSCWYTRPRSCNMNKNYMRLGPGVR